MEDRHVQPSCPRSCFVQSRPAPMAPESSVRVMSPQRGESARGPVHPTSGEVCSRPVDSRLLYRLEAGPAGEVLHLEGAGRPAAWRASWPSCSRLAASVRLTVDLSRVDAMDSAGVAVLVNGWRRSQAGLVLGPTSAGRRAGADPVPGRRRGGAARPPPIAVRGRWARAAYVGKDAVRDFLQLAADTTFAHGRRCSSTRGGSAGTRWPSRAATSARARCASSPSSSSWSASRSRSRPPTSCGSSAPPSTSPTSPPSPSSARWARS